MSFIDLFMDFGPKLLHGFWVTLYLAIIATLIGAVIALPTALLRVHGPMPVKAIIITLVSFLRGTPMLAQLFLVYYGSGQFRMELQEIGLWIFFKDPLFCTLLTFSLNTAAYQIEILRGAIRGVDNGEIEAGHAVGMNSYLIHRRIILPHAYRIAMPALGNEFVLMIKGSAIASIVSILDLIGVVRSVYAKTFDFNIYLIAAVFYLVISFIFGKGWHHLENFVSPQFRKKYPRLDKK